MRPWFLSLLSLQCGLIATRWWIGDFHGALLMGIVTLVGVLTVTVEAGVDIVYCSYYGLMAFVGGLMDFALVIEKAWQPLFHLPREKAVFAAIIGPMVYLMCSLVQLCTAFLCYQLYADAEDENMDGEHGIGIMATQEQVQIYSAVLEHSQQRRTAIQA